jgi:hypothetical protein
MGLRLIGSGAGWEGDEDAEGEVEDAEVMERVHHCLACYLHVHMRAHCCFHSHSHLHSFHLIFDPFFDLSKLPLALERLPRIAHTPHS